MHIRFFFASVALLLALMLSGQWLHAQQQNQQEALQRLEKMSTDLNLTADQKQKIRPILLDEAPKLKAVRENASLGKVQKAMQMKQIEEDTDAKLKPILTAQQYEQLLGMQAQQRQQMMEKARQQ